MSVSDRCEPDFSLLYSSLTPKRPPKLVVNDDGGGDDHDEDDKYDDDDDDDDGSAHVQQALEMFLEGFPRT